MSDAVDLERIADDWGRHPVEAFVAVGEGLRHASQQLGRDRARGADRHLTAAELVQGVLDVMVERCGMLARSVLLSWGVGSADDLGAITFHLIACGVLGKQENDHPEDFSALPPLSQMIRQRLRHQMQHKAV
ncbi:MAG: hypothetical protein EA401_05010 [Planctomycetota bacterium]|nr:MAG: hypothetical protein EA401_05010 [Planctomycetota bacterium]